jgi:hypothetical protein
MIVIIDTTKGEAYNFKTRKDAGQFIGVSLPTLRNWLTNPFFLYRTLIITSTGNGKIEKSKAALAERIQKEYTEANTRLAKEAFVQGLDFNNRNIRTADPRPEESTNVVRSGR